MYIVKGSDIYQLPDQFYLTDTGFSKNSSLLKLAGSDGGYNKGDKTVNSRTLRLSGSLWDKTDPAFQTKWNALFQKLSQEDFYLRRGNWQILISQADNIESQFDSGLYDRFGELNIDLIAANPLWEYITSSSGSATCDTSPKQFTINNTGNYKTYPVITITATENNSSVQLKNITDDDLLFTYSDIWFTSGKSLIIDCQEGTVELASIDTIRYFEGQFLKLLPGNNIFEYTGDKVTISMSWKNRKL
jgi:hypothetical protein